MSKGPKILLLDIETSPIISYTWGLWDQNVGLNQIKVDWNIISWGAKWLDTKNPKVIYQDLRNSKNVHDDGKLIKNLWRLLDEADIVVTQNGKSFDIKKINARFAINGYQPPSPFKQIDTLRLARKHFGFTSNKLEYMADKLNTKYKKLKHESFSGFELWRECMNGNQKAWKEMEKYNKHDVLSLEELYTKLIPWDSSVNMAIYFDNLPEVCTCGHTKFYRNGSVYTTTGKFQRFICRKCGKVTRGKTNLIDKKKRKATHASVSR